MKRNICILIFISVLLISCMNNAGEERSAITSEIEGTYTYKYPKGQFEVVTIKLDSTYLRKIYSTENEYRDNGNPLYVNEERWSIIGKELDFNRWLSICYLGLFPDSILAEPFYCHMPISWHASTNEHKSFLNAYYENGYVLTKE